jgi:uncharacterized protein (TIGR02217 family)
MAQNLQLPFADVRLYGDDIITGTAGGPEFSTDVTINHGGFEQRNANWDMPLGRWDIGQRGYCQATKDYLVSFFRQRRGRFQGFLWRDLADWQATALPLASEQGFTTQGLVVFAPGSNVGQLIKRYSAGNFVADRTITKPRAASVELPDGYTLGQLGAVTTTTESSADVPVDFDFDVPVRFDTDHLRYNLQSTEAKPGTADFESIFYIDSLPIVEQRASNALIDSSSAGGSGGNNPKVLAWSLIANDATRFSPNSADTYTPSSYEPITFYFQIYQAYVPGAVVFFSGAALGLWDASYDAATNLGAVVVPAGSFTANPDNLSLYLSISLSINGQSQGDLTLRIIDNDGGYEGAQWIAFAPL